MTLQLSRLISMLSFAIVLCGIIPLFPWLSAFPRTLLALGLAVAVWQEYRSIRPLNNWVVNSAVVPVFVYYATQFSRTNPVTPVVSILSVMLAVRLIGPKSVRHYLQIQALSLFCLAASSLFDLSPLFLVYLSLLLMLGAVSLVLLTFHAHAPELQLTRNLLRNIVVAGLLMPLASLPMLAIFFPVLPRTQLPLWNFMGASTTANSGFSDKVEPGGSATVAETFVTAFRAEMPRINQQQLYWRGTVFNSMEGNRWLRDSHVPVERSNQTGDLTVQTIYPEPGNSRSLFGLDTPMSINHPRSKQYPDRVYEKIFLSSKRQSYQVESAMGGLLPVKGSIDRDFYLNLPNQLPSRIIALGRSFQKRGQTNSLTVQNISVFFQTGNFNYSMTGLPTGDRALENFLFETRSGNCEFYAASFAILARSAGIPARVVGGYLGGEYNELGKYYLITENMAHVWVEAFIDGAWVRIDPSSFAMNASSLWGEKKKRDPLLKLRMAMDSFNHAWNRSVITYDFERQVEGARAAARSLQGLKTDRILPAIAPYIMLFTGIGMVGVIFKKRRTFFPTREKRLLRQFYRKIQQDCGISGETDKQGIFEISDAAGNNFARDFAMIYGNAVYHDRKITDEEAKQLRLLLKGGFKNKL